MAEIIQLRCHICGFQWTEDLDEIHEDPGRCPNRCDEDDADVLTVTATDRFTMGLATCSTEELPVVHTPECEQLLAQWRTHPVGDVEYRIAQFARTHTDPELCALTITMLDEDRGTPAEQVARALWPVLTHEVTR